MTLISKHFLSDLCANLMWCNVCMITKEQKIVFLKNTNIEHGCVIALDVVMFLCDFCLLCVYCNL